MCLRQKGGKKIEVQFLAGFHEAEWSLRQVFLLASSLLLKYGGSYQISRSNSDLEVYSLV